MDKKQLIALMLREYAEELEALSLSELIAQYRTIKAAKEQPWTAEGIAIVQPRAEESN